MEPPRLTRSSTAFLFLASCVCSGRKPGARVHKHSSYVSYSVLCDMPLVSNVDGNSQATLTSCFALIFKATLNPERATGSSDLLPTPRQP